MVIWSRRIDRVNRLQCFYGVMPQAFKIIGSLSQLLQRSLRARHWYQDLLRSSVKRCVSTLAETPAYLPTEERGQLYVAGVNWLLFLGCTGIVLYFQKSTNMEAAYGLAITLCMIATPYYSRTILLRNGCGRSDIRYLFVYSPSRSVSWSQTWRNSLMVVL